MADVMNILVLNAGSSSQKMALYRFPAGQGPAARVAAVWTAHVDWTRDDDRVFVRTESDGAAHEAEAPRRPRKEMIEQVIASLTHGVNPILGDGSSLNVVGTIERMMPGVPHVAVFDTAFHRTMPEAAAMYPLPYEWCERGIRRYGFHGISHQYCTERAAEILDRRVNDLRLVTCHLGNGCSLAAVRGGVSVDTTMGLTPLEGIMMASRSGSVDPAIPLYLMREHGLALDRVDAMLNAESGLKGVSGLSGDMRAIMDAVNAGHPRATLALDMYVHRLRKAIGGMVAVLGGADALIFTAGVGEHASTVRERACRRLESMGIQIDTERNRTARADDDIAMPDSPMRILIVHTDEDWITARACRALLGNGIPQ
jgi:acetate kinase